MQHRLQFAWALLLPLAALAQDQITVEMTTPGTLPEIIGEENKAEVKSLTVKGDINGTDISFIRDMGIGVMDYSTWQYNSNLLILDLSEANIVEGGDPYSNKWPYPETVANEIGEEMFSRFASLMELRLPDSATKICKNGINNNIKLAELTLPADLDTIQKWGIYWCPSLTELTLPAKTRVVEESSFYGCGIEKIVIESTDIELQPGAFAGLDNLADIVSDDANPSFSSIDGVLFSKDGSRLMIYPGGRKDPAYSVPEGVSEICGYGFYGNSNLTEVSFPGSLETIGEYAFDGCTSLTDVKYPQSLKTIGNWAFAICSAFTSVDLEHTSVTSIGDNAFFGINGLEAVTLPQTIEHVGESAFSTGKYTKLTLPESLATIGKNAFAVLTLEDVYAERTVPAECDGDVFAQGMIASVLFQTPTAVLHVPEGCLDAYSSAPGFMEFYTILDDIVPTGVTAPEAEADGTPEYYDLSGRRIVNPSAGIYIARYPDGKAVKTVIR